MPGDVLRGWISPTSKLPGSAEGLAWDSGNWRMLGGVLRGWVSRGASLGCRNLEGTGGEPHHVALRPAFGQGLEGNSDRIDSLKMKNPIHQKTQLGDKTASHRVAEGICHIFIQLMTHIQDTPKINKIKTTSGRGGRNS